MAVNYAQKYSSKIDEKFTQQSVTNDIVNADYEFVGVKTVKVFSNGVAAMNDYTMTGTGRYGTAEELSNEVQELTVTQDKSFTFTIDRANYDDTQMTIEAGKSLSRQLEQVVIPMVDKYRLGVIAANAGTTVTLAITSANAYEAILDASVVLTDNSVPMAGRVIEATPAFYKKIKLDASFVKASDVAQDLLIKGSIGMIDGMNVKLIPTSYVPAGVEFIVTHPIATVGVQKLADYKTHDNPPGINGWLVEGRMRYDAFVLNNKKKAIYVHKGV